MTDYAASSAYRKVVVNLTNIESAAGGFLTALVTDLVTKAQFTIPMGAPGRVDPQEGDYWQLSREMGYWSFDKLITKGPPRVVGGMTETVNALQDLGLIQYVPEYSALNTTPDRVIEVPHGAYIGEVRPFLAGTAPEDWLPCDGSLQSRIKYRRLFNLIGTTYGVGDGDTTFGMPTISGFPGAATQLQGDSAWYTAWGVLDRALCASGTATTASSFQTIASRSINQVASRLYGFQWSGALVAVTGGEVVQVRVTVDGVLAYLWNFFFGNAGTYSVGGVFWTQMTTGNRTVNLEFARISGGTSVTHTAGQSNSIMFTVSDCGPGTAPPNPASSPPDVYLGSWNTPTLTAQWAEYGAGFQSPRFRREGDCVRIQGLYRAVGSVASGAAIFTLPSGYRPSQIIITNQHARIATVAQAARVDIEPAGVVRYNSSGTFADSEWTTIETTFPANVSLVTSPATYYICAR